MRPIVGLRGWKADRDGMLHSIYYDATWPRLAPLVAEDRGHERGNPPAFSCDECSGVYAYNAAGIGDLCLSARVWIQEFGFGAGLAVRPTRDSVLPVVPESEDDPYGSLAIGTVHLWGKYVKGHTHGYRAERAYPGELYLLRPHRSFAELPGLARAVTGNYGTPCHVLGERETWDHLKVLIAGNKAA